MKTPNRPPSCDLPKEFYSSKLKPCPYCDSERIDKGNSSICLCSDCGLWGPDNDPDGEKWNSIPRRSELVELQAKAKAYDEGREQWQIWNPCHSKIEMVGRTEDEAIIAFRKSITYSNPPEPWSQYLAAGYTCRKVRVCKEVDE